MTTTDMKTTTGFDVAWAGQAAERAERAGEPAWALERRREAAELARNLSFPSRYDELWRRTDFRTLEAAIEGLDPFTATAGVRSAEELPLALRERVEGGTSSSMALIVQRNADVVLESMPKSLQSQGVIVCSLERAVREHGDLVRERFGALIEPGYDWYTAIAAATRSGGAFVHVPDGVEAEAPIRIFHWIDGGRIAMPRTIVSVGRNAKATVIEEELSETAEGIAFHNGGTEVFVGADARLVFATLQDWGRNVYHYGNQRARIEGNGELQWIQTMLGSRMAKTNSYFDLAGPGSQAFVHGFKFGDTRQHFHLHTLQRHLVDHTTSDLLIKTCLRDRARSIYQGLIQVSEGAQRTDAYQANRNLLLSDQARADSIPGLEILANDVRCTHGATIGHVDPDQMYYLRSRGLPEAEAQRLIVEGFFAPVLDRIPLESVRDQLRQVIQHKIG
jgi:Fe-S cluster assembly protein SufD